MSTWKKLPWWIRIPVAVLLFLVLLYLFGFLLFSCGSEDAAAAALAGRG